MVKEENNAMSSGAAWHHGEGRTVKEGLSFFLHHKVLCINTNPPKVKG